MKKQPIVNLCLQCAMREQQDGKTIRYAGKRAHEGVCERCWEKKLITAYHAEEALPPLREEKAAREKPLQRVKTPEKRKTNPSVTRKARAKTSSVASRHLPLEKGKADTMRRKDEITAVSFGGENEKVSVKLDMSVRTLEILRDAADKWGISMGEAVGSALRFCMKGKRR